MSTFTKFFFDKSFPMSLVYEHLRVFEKSSWTLKKPCQTFGKKIWYIKLYPYKRSKRDIKNKL